MSESGVKRATVYFEADLHKAIRLKAAHTQRSISEIDDIHDQKLVVMVVKVGH